ncbi:MAG: DUF3108 domain-containing protein [Nitrospiria bacterium]
MKRVYPLLFPILVLMLAQSQASEPISVPSEPQGPMLAYAPGERLVYDVRYFGINAGTAVLEVLEKTEMKEREVYHVLSTARSNDFISHFYPVDNRIESFIDTEGLYSHFIKIKQRQGKRRREKLIDFNQAHHRAVQIKNNRSEIFEIPPNVQDSLSALYFFRTLGPVEVGSSTFINVHESRKNWELEIQVLEKELLSTKAGTFDTIKVKALVRYEGLLMDKGDVYIWFTDDIRRIPVKIKSKIKIGKIAIVLKSGTEQNDVSASPGIAM